MENGMGSGEDDAHDQLTQMVAELTFQNDYLKAQFEDWRKKLPVCGDGNGGVQGGEAPPEGGLERLWDEIRTLGTEIQEKMETRKTAEDALEHLKASYAEADAKVQELSTKLAEAEQNMEEEIKLRDDKYTDLDSKFGRLPKCGKQWIQEIQKGKDDLEAHLCEVKEKAEQASAQHSSEQQELECTVQQANEARRSMEVEKQQLWSSNVKLRENIDELHHALEAKENALEGLRQSLFVKEQMLENAQNLLKAAEDKKQASMADLSAKHQKIVESLKAQLADALSDRSKAAETITSLQVLIVEKDSRTAELEAAASGEAVLLKAAVEAATQEFIRLKNEHEKEREGWEATCQSLRDKLEASESACLHYEIEAAKTKCQLELELSLQNQTLNTRDAEIAAAKEEISRLENEFSSYKVRAHALLQKKEAELSAARDTKLIKAQEDAVKMLDNAQNFLKAAEDKKQASMADLSAKHQKIVERLETQLADALSDRCKATETITSLQVLIVEKDSRIAELETAASGEAVRLKAAVEAAKQELIHLKNEHISRLENEFSSYKVRAHALLQKKEAELSAARDTELIKAQKEAVKEAERKVALALAERDKALQDLQNTLTEHDNEIGACSSTSVTMSAAPVECTESDGAEKSQKSGHLLKSVAASSSFCLSTSPTSSSLPFVTSAISSQSNASIFSSTGNSIFGVSASALSGATAFGKGSGPFVSQAAQSGSGTSFGQPSNVPAQNSSFGSTPTPSGGAAFQFANSQSTFPQSQTPFQAAGSIGFGWGFSMDSGRGDNSGRRFTKAKRDKHRKK